MLQGDLDEIVRSVSRDRTVFHYFKDRYALLLLGHALARWPTVGELKQSPFAGLLRKPIVKSVTTACGGGRLDAYDLMAAWPTTTRPFRLTFGQWPRRGIKPGSWAQTTRPGFSFVLQLNFPVSHNRRMRQIIGPETHLPTSFGHPWAGGGEVTLAWARLDIDVERGEALIEELQSDWVRRIRTRTRWTGAVETRGRWTRYFDELLKPHTRLWSEALLAACLSLLVDELGVRRIWYHTWRSGAQLKRITGRRPPRSLYTDLPKRFCFQPTTECPEFLLARAGRRLRARLTERSLEWFVLEL